MTVFKNESEGIDQIVGLNDIEFYSFCEHHLLPFFGKAFVYYIP
jgi:GTP cyclohydrolase I